jgi:hypothetical protein
MLKHNYNLRLLFVSKTLKNTRLEGSNTIQYNRGPRLLGLQYNTIQNIQYKQYKTLGLQDFKDMT